MKLIIDRQTWLRGEGWDDSFLLRPEDGKMCCLGFLSDQCGVPLKAISDAQTPVDLSAIHRSLLPEFLFRELEDDRDVHSKECMELMQINDNQNLDPKEREDKLTEVFTANGIEVQFIN